MARVSGGDSPSMPHRSFIVTRRHASLSTSPKTPNQPTKRFPSSWATFVKFVQLIGGYKLLFPIPETHSTFHRRALRTASIAMRVSNPELFAPRNFKANTQPQLHPALLRLLAIIPVLHFGLAVKLTPALPKVIASPKRLKIRVVKCKPSLFGISQIERH